jgi:mRNA-degrading endonuclease RelE of RelBE toxin-antitoxin system
MNVTFTKSFERTLKKSKDQEGVKKTIRTLLRALETGIKPKGLGIKKLQGNIWEMRSGLKVRVLFVLLSNEIRLLFVGYHDDIRAYLKDI